MLNKFFWIYFPKEKFISNEFTPTCFKQSFWYPYCVLVSSLKLSGVLMSPRGDLHSLTASLSPRRFEKVRCTLHFVGGKKSHYLRVTPINTLKFLKYTAVFPLSSLSVFLVAWLTTLTKLSLELCQWQSHPTSMFISS